MRRIRILGLCLVTAFTISVIAVASASAAPEYYGINNCTKKFGALWNGGTCPTTKKVLAAQKVAYSTKGAAAKLEGGLVIECKTSEAKGSTEGTKKTVKIKVTFTGCKAGGSPCQTSLATLGVIKTLGLKGELTTASETSGGATTVVKRDEPEGTAFVKFSCGSKGEIKVEVKGKIFFALNPVFSGTPEQANDSLKVKEIAEAKSPIAGCGGQKFLYENGTGPCGFLHTVENGKELEPSWDVFVEEATYKSAIQVFS